MVLSVLLSLKICVHSRVTFISDSSESPDRTPSMDIRATKPFGSVFLENSGPLVLVRSVVSEERCKKKEN